MSEPSIFDDPEFEPSHTHHAGKARHHAKRSALRGCLPVLVVLAVLVAGGWGGFVFLKGKVDEWTAGPADYDGSSLGEEVVFEVASGQSIAAMGQELEELGVVASQQAFVDASRALPEEDTRGIQVGAYLMREQMPAADAIAVLVDPANLVQTMVTIPEGFTVDQVVDRLAAETDFGKRRFRNVLSNPGRIGLPEYADGNPEGYLFPATYPVNPNDTPRTILTAMVDRWRQAATDADLEARAAELGHTPHELMTIASLVEAESPPEYMTKVSRVIYNRVAQPGGETNGLLQLDATVNYAHGKNLGARTTAEDREIDSPYNTYRYPGLPPGPIEAPGDAAIEAAAAPADGDWLYYVTVNLATGETKFAETFSGHEQNVAELNEYCRNESDRC